MNAWTPQGPLLSFTAASSAPTSVQVTALSATPSMQVMVNNTSGTIDAVIGWSTNDAQAKYNAAASSDVTNCCYIMHSTIQVLTVPNGCYMTGISVSSTAVIKVQSGIGN